MGVFYVHLSLAATPRLSCNLCLLLLYLLLYLLLLYLLLPYLLLLYLLLLYHHLLLVVFILSFKLSFYS